MDAKPSDLPPHDESNERIVLGSILYDSENCLNAAEEFGLHTEDFYRKTHKDLWMAIQELSKKGKHLDSISAIQRLKNNAVTFDVGYVSNLVSEEVSAEILPVYLQRLRNDGMLRQAIRTASTHLNAAKDRPDDIDGFIDGFESEVLEIRSLQSPQDAKQASNLVSVVFDQINSGGKPHGIPCGLQPIDDITRGWQPSDMIIIAARPGMGKTALGLQFACHASANNHPVAFFSQEMSAESLMYRVISGESKVPLKLLTEGPEQILTISSREDMEQAYQRIGKFPLFFDDEPRITPMKIRAKCRRWKKKHNIQLIVIDYLQLLHTTDKTESRQIEIAKISGLMKAMAMELEIPVIILSQLNRKVEDRSSGEPKLSDLRESGAIEQDADLVFLLQSIADEKQDETRDVPSNMKINLAKHRNGKTDSYEVVFKPEITRFELQS